MRRTEVLRANRANISYGAGILKAGGLVAFPTETVYGLGANLLEKKAIARLYAVKRRPKNKPFAVLIPDASFIRKTRCVMNKEARRLSDKFWPGPLTIILKSRNGRKTGFRMPDNRIALALLKKAGVPVACPSANLSGNVPPKSARGVLAQLDGKIDLLLDGGVAKIGIESTVVDLTIEPPAVLREGAIRSRDIFKTIRKR